MILGNREVLYYYDRMFTLCYMLHLLLTGQDIHDLKLHVTEQENVHFEPKFTGWSIWPLAGWVCGRELRGTEVGAKAPTNEVAVVRHAYHSHFMTSMAAYLPRELLRLPLFNQNMNQKKLAFVF